MGPPSSIASVLQACASTSNFRAKHALECELKVLEHYLKHKYQLLYHRQKVSGVELDFVLYSPLGEVVCVEVKSNSSGWSIADRIKRQQLERLFFAEQRLQAQLKIKVRTEIALLGKIIEIYQLAEML